MATVGKARGWRALSIKAPKMGCGQAIEDSLHESRSNITVMVPVTTLRRTVEFLQGGKLHKCKERCLPFDFVLFYSIRNVLG